MLWTDRALQTAVHKIFFTIHLKACFESITSKHGPNFGPVFVSGSLWKKGKHLNAEAEIN